MKDALSFIPSKKTVKIFFVIYGGAFVLGLLGLVFLPKEEAMLRKVALGISYFFGLPIVVGYGLELLKKARIWSGK